MNTIQEYTFSSADGVTALHAVKWLPEGEPKMVLHITHGMVEYIERYSEFARFLTGHGFVVAGHDHIGHGESVRSPEERGIVHTDDPSGVMTADMLTHFRLLREEYPGLPIFMLGHSMGSYTLRRFLSEYGTEIEGLSGAIIMGTGSESTMTLQMGRAVIKVLTAIRSKDHRSRFAAGLMYGRPYKKFDIRGKDLSRSWLTKDREIVRRYYQDLKCTFLFSLGAYKGLVDTCIYDNDLSLIRRIPKALPILFVSGAQDPVGNMGEGVKKAWSQFRMVNMTDVTLHLYENDRHEILNETDRAEVYEDLLEWMLERTERNS